MALSSSFISSSSSPLLHSASPFDLRRNHRRASWRPTTGTSSDADGSARVLRCALGSRPRRASGTPRPSSSSPSTLPRSSAGSRSPPKQRHWKEGPSSSSTLPRSSAPARSPPNNRHWKEGPSYSSSSTLPRSSAPASSPPKAWVCTVTEALADRIQKRQWQEALKVFDMLKEQPFYSPKEGTYMKLLILLGKSGQAIRAHQLFDDMMEEGCQPNPELYTALLAAYCRSNLLDEAFSILEKMKTLPLCQPDVYTYSTLLKACTEASRFDLVDSLYQDMSERMISPNTVTQNIVLSGYGKAGKFDEMEKVLSGMLESSTCKPDVWTMNIILSLFGNMSQVDAMEKWYERFRAYGIEPETRTFNILIGAYGKKRMYDKMTAVMEYMRKLEFPWTTSTYNNIIEAFAEVGDAKNMECAFNQMRAEGMKSDTKTFCCLLNGYSNAGQFHKVISTVQLAERLEVRRNTFFYNALISACAKADDLLEMERVFKHMKDGECTPDSITFGILVEAYRKEGMTDKIYDLEQENPGKFEAKLVTP
ncbi:pentatricopeptide repeat-containing protein At3g06430, chloroplastic-like isoform X2 [Zingiber officinale]|uniref:pentatricopeptide repeat-containing protein At3g06430, chloroplastic-like isoform X2 n=1 Tax=Zingiber officinale TaxID=94328 RepID=UPI001C4BC479|nr:pentatricopeptide repeat-containing protein At3g06430, chloroplastic-like isoform X2 [Zingiber officinale]